MTIQETRVMSQSVTVRGVTCNSKGPNSDGCDPESCKDVLIEDCVFDTGDDCITIKSGRNADGRRAGVAAENIIVSRCRMRAGHGSVVMGRELSGGIRNVFVENCHMSCPDLVRGIRIKTNAMRGGGAENLIVRDLRVGNARYLFVINFYYEEGDDGPFYPDVHHNNLRDINCANSQRVMDILGFKHAHIRDISLRNITVDNAAKVSRVSVTKNLVFENVTVNGSPIVSSDDLTVNKPQTRSIR